MTKVIAWILVSEERTVEIDLPLAEDEIHDRAVLDAVRAESPGEDIRLNDFEVLDDAAA